VAVQNISFEDYLEFRWINQYFSNKPWANIQVEVESGRMFASNFETEQRDYIKFFDQE
jgi:hypothetical protein